MRPALPTPTPTDGTVRAARAGVLGSVALALAAGAHVGAGGALPGIGGLAFLLAATVAVVLVATTRRLHAATLGATLGGLQLALHTGFTLLAPAGGAAVSAHGHHHATITVTSAPAGSDVAMLGLHAVATVLTALVLARGEALLWLLATSVAPVVAWLVARCAALVRSLRGPVAVLPVLARVLRRQHWALCSPLRGPPVVA